MLHTKTKNKLLNRVINTAYSNFSFATIKQQYGLNTIKNELAFRLKICQPDLVSFLEKIVRDNISLAEAIGTEKARSELLIMPVLVELRKILNQQILLFSGVEFNVQAELGLTGICDYIISQSLEQYTVEAPVLMLVGARKADLNLQ